MDEIVRNQRIDEFLHALEILCRGYDVSISHEDSQGSFILQKYEQSNMVWLKSAVRELEDA